MKVNGIDCELRHEATIVLMAGADGMFYAQSGSLCKGATPEQAVRKCVKCMNDYGYARKHDMYQNGQVNATVVPQASADKYDNLMARAAL